MGKSIDQNLLCLVMANRSFVKGDTLNGLKYYQHFDKLNFAASRDKYEFLEKNFFLNQLNELCINLALIGRNMEAVELAEKFEKDNEKAQTYVLMAEKVFIKKTDPTAFEYIDSIFSKSAKFDFSQVLFETGVDYRSGLIRLLSRIGGKRLNKLSESILSEFMNDNRTSSIVNRVDGIAGEGNFYLARQAIPSTLIEVEDIITRAILIWHASLKKETEKEKEKHKKHIGKELDKVLFGKRLHDVYGDLFHVAPEFQ